MARSKLWTKEFLRVRNVGHTVDIVVAFRRMSISWSLYGGFSWLIVVSESKVLGSSG